VNSAVRQLRVQTAAELFALLVDEDEAVRLAALSSIAMSPDKALRFGRHDDADVVDILVARVRDPAARFERIAVLAALRRFRDARARALFCELLAESSDDELLFQVAECLEEHHLEIETSFLRRLLQGAGSVARIRIAARWMAERSDCTVEDRLRIAAFGDAANSPPPPVDPATLAAWLAAVSGSSAAQFRALLETGDTGNLVRLAQSWKLCDASTRVWLLAQPAVLASCDESLLDQALADEDPLVLVAALRAISGVPAQAERYAAHGTRLARHDHAGVRCAALRLVPDGFDWLAFLRDEADTEARVAALRGAASNLDEAAVPLLLDSLQSRDWAERATATDLLIALGPASIEPARALIGHDQSGVRIAAARILREATLQSAP